jgi:hypothetical protein
MGMANTTQDDQCSQEIQPVTLLILRLRVKFGFSTLIPGSLHKGDHKM